MKKIVLLLIVLFVLVAQGSAFSDVRNIGEPYQLSYVPLDVDGGYITGQTITVKIKKVSNGYWYDFSDSTFKASGWTNKTANLSEDATNKYYFYTFTPPSSETTAEQYVFVVDNAATGYVDHQTLTVTYQSIGTSTATPATISDAVWDEPLSGHTTSGTAGHKLNKAPTQIQVGN